MQPKANVTRQTVNLSSFPDLVVIYLGMRVRSLRGLLTVLRFGPRISSAVAEKPPGLLLHESLIFSIFPLHVGMRQYWRDFDSWKPGREPCRTRSGGRVLCGIPEEPDFGMKLTSVAAEWRPSTTI